MNAAVTEPRAWSPARRWLWITLVFATHLGLIFVLGNRQLAKPRPPAPAPSLSLAPDPSEWLELNDPTLFALPHRQGFAGAAWMKISTVKDLFPDLFQPLRWTEPPRLLPLPVTGLGLAFAEFMNTNVFVSQRFETKPAPGLPLPVAQETAVAPATSSTLRVAGALMNRRLLNPPQLQTWPAPDLLTNTVVQVLVNAEGNVVSLTHLTVSGSRPADQSALDVARAARFEPLRLASPALTVGALIFEWHTEPLTNAPAANP